MLRFLSERRAWVVAAFVALMLVIGLFLWGAPRATVRASNLIGERLGVDAHINEAHLSLGGVELVGVEMRGRYGGFLVRIDQVDARMSLLGALFRGARSVRAVSVRGIEVTADLTHDGFDDSIAELRGRISGRASGSTEAAPSARSGGGRTYAIDGLTVHVVDSDGPLASMMDVSLHKEGDALRAGVVDTLLGDKSADHATVGASKLVLSRNEGTWQLRELEIQGASIRSLRNGEGEGRPLTTRIRDTMSRLRGTDTDTGADADADTGTGTGAGAGADTGTGTGTGAGTDTDTGTGAGTGTDTGTGTGTGAGTGAGAGTGTGTGTVAVPVSLLA